MRPDFFFFFLFFPFSVEVAEESGAAVLRACIPHSRLTISLWLHSGGGMSAADLHVATGV